MVEFDTFSYGWIVNDIIELLNLFIFLVMVMVFVEFLQEGSGCGSESLEENFNLKEDVEFFCIGVGSTPCIETFFKGE